MGVTLEECGSASPPPLPPTAYIKSGSLINIKAGEGEKERLASMSFIDPLRCN